MGFRLSWTLFLSFSIHVYLEILAWQIRNIHTKYFRILTSHSILFILVFLRFFFHEIFIILILDLLDLSEVRKMYLIVCSSHIFINRFIINSTTIILVILCDTHIIGLAYIGVDWMRRSVRVDVIIMIDSVYITMHTVRLLEILQISVFLLMTFRRYYFWQRIFLEFELICIIEI